MQEQLSEVRSLITLRFGADCWNEIIAEKAKRERIARDAKRREQAELQKQHPTFLLSFLSLSLYIILEG